jgi:hypothetical protein
MIKPWIGENWGTPSNPISGVRLLVLGESAHAEEYEIGTQPENLLIETVLQFLERGEKWRFYRNLTALLADKDAAELTSVETRCVWDAIAFFNYVPVIAANWPRQRPAKEMFEAGRAPLLDFVQKESPDAILVCGMETWWWILRGIGYDGKSWETPIYEIYGIPAGCVQHPSSAFSRATWRPIVDDLLNRARSRKVISHPK